MNEHLQYLRYILRHKKLVYQEGRKLGLGRIRLILHDWQKFTVIEWFAYLDSFYRYPDRNTQPDNVKRAFDEAWLHHQRSGSAHHWQSHVLQRDDGSAEPLDMPDTDRREMLADWRAMGRTFGEEPPAVDWYEKKKDKMILHPNTRKWVEGQLRFGVLDRPHGNHGLEDDDASRF